MFQFPESCLLWTMYSSRDTRLLTGGLPHSEISGSKLVYSSPKLIAVSHVLLRLLMPRHSPFALSSLALFYKYYQLKTLCLECSRSISQALYPKLSRKQDAARIPHPLLKVSLPDDTHLRKCIIIYPIFIFQRTRKGKALDPRMLAHPFRTRSKTRWTAEAT